MHLHEQGLRLHGGLPGILKQGCVEAAVGSTISAELYERTGDSIDFLRLAAHALLKLASAHCFADGNKRVAWETCTTILNKAAGLDVPATDAETVAFVLSIADGAQRDVDEIATWLAARIVTLR